MVFNLDPNGSFSLRWPSTSQKVLELAAAYLAFEQGQPATNQLMAPSLSQVQAAYQAASEAAQAAGSAEATRASAAEDYRQALEEAIPLLRRAILMLKAKYIDNLAQLEAWGLHTRQGARGVVATSPDTQKGWRAFLSSYVTQEQSLEASQRLTDPDLATLQALNTRLGTALTGRTDARSSRSIQISERTTQVAQLADLLQTAAAVLVTTRYNFSVTRDLQQWGFDVVERKS